jgi:hypothetical protein
MVKSDLVLTCLMLFCLSAGASAAGEATMTATITLKDTATHDSAGKSSRERSCSFVVGSLLQLK